MRTIDKRVSAGLSIVSILFLATPLINIVLLTDGPLRFVYSGLLLLAFWLVVIALAFIFNPLRRNGAGPPESDA